MLQGFAQIAQQMETVGDLHRIGRALAGSFGVSTRSVTTDHFRWGVVAQPLGNGVGLGDRAEDPLLDAAPDRKEWCRSAVPCATPNRRCPTREAKLELASAPPTCVVDGAATCRRSPPDPVFVRCAPPLRRPTPDPASAELAPCAACAVHRWPSFPAAAP